MHCSISALAQSLHSPSFSLFTFTALFLYRKICFIFTDLLHSFSFSLLQDKRPRRRCQQADRRHRLITGNIDISNMETRPASSAAVLEVLYGEDNYLEWSVRVKTYLMAQDLWEIVEATNEPPTPENEAAFKAWSKMNAMALYGIQNSCGPDTFYDIMEITSARIAWETLAEKYKPKGPDPSSSMASVPLEEEDNLDSSTESGTSQISADIREITSDRMASVPLEEDKLDSSPKPGESDEVGNIKIYMDLYKALRIGDWNAANEFLKRHPQAISAKITVTKKTALHVAAEAGHVHIVEELVKQMSRENLEIKDIYGYTALAHATYYGNYRIAECMLGKNENLISIEHVDEQIPVVLALTNGHLKLARYLYSLTMGAFKIDEGSIPEILMPENGTMGASVVCAAIYTNALDIALDLVNRCPRLVVAKDRYGESPFYALACMPGYFLRGNRLVFWKRWIYSGIHIQSGGPINDIRLNIQKPAGNRSRSNGKEIIGSGIYSLSQLVSNLRTLMGMLAPSTSLNDIPGAALQMQRELQWFKEVESIALPRVHACLNNESLTPRELFTKNHKDMRKDGEKWMKDTATSCTVVGALIITIMFTAVFTVPGDNNRNDSFSKFSNKKLYIVFIVSDALSLFSSSTSVLMFLGILTSHYAEEDFLESLPRKMIIGLSTLFFSIVAMMITFSTALLLMLHEQSWVLKPIICLASIPITLFVLMQFPLLVTMTISTYGPSIFNRKMNRWF